MAETKLKSSQALSDDGWITANESWSYASASTITVPSGAASKYQKGDRIKWTQTTVKYGVIVAVADTVLTIAVNTDYTVADAAITANYYSHQANPLGYPGWFAQAAPSISVTYYDNGSGGQVTVSETRYNIIGNICTLHCRTTGTKAGTNAVLLVIADSQFPPILRANNTARSMVGSIFAITGAGLISTGPINWESNTYYASSIASINDNTVISDCSFIMTYEI
jgi:hypothetical protein